MMIHSSKIFLVIVLLSVAVPSLGHTYLSSVYLGNRLLNEGDCVRPHPQFEKDYPIPLVTDEHNTCGWLPAAANPANRKCPIAAGSTMGIQWHHNHNGPTDDILDPTHKGPVILYLAKSETGKGAVWFKIYEDGYDSTSKTWGTDRLIANRGRLDFTIPSDIAPGNYLLRGEVLALHNAYALHGIQPYVGCVELTISGDGRATPQGYSFPGTYTPSGPGMMIDLYQPYNSYTIPGPAVYRPSQTTTPPTTRPTNPPAATPRPTTPPVPTSAPTTRPTQPTTPPASSPTTSPRDTVKVMLQGGSNQYWLSLGVSGGGGGETIVKVELRDGKSNSDWYSLSNQQYGYVYDRYEQLSLPLSVRVTSSTGKQVELTSAFSSWEMALIDSGRSF